MKCQSLFSEKNKKNISKCQLLKLLPSILIVKEWFHSVPISLYLPEPDTSFFLSLVMSQLCIVLRGTVFYPTIWTPLPI